ncbi:DUF4407 domain-containing protein [Streptomyces sp. NBC_00566]|uniref:DUF4407 domain-containing protein n=1 Tax=Streptomyces sp. NBC_00566 TaxID=2975778 RepID=UPI002E81EF0A|nr:DUF4407 domain-containing protein [Streptomyces sp. NBC_00566]WUB85947.1 DUF4407 domain-containing protein [Streptomyces sp. NBC_00566]
MATEPHPRAPRGLGRLLRAGIGVHEPVLDTVPSERPVYTRYGGIVLATALLGGISAAVALDALLQGASTWAMVAAGTVWTAFVYLVDSWLVSSTHGKIGRSRNRALMPRLLLSILIGLALAEPLLFQVFAPEMDKHLTEGRDRAVQTYYGRLLACNPVDGTTTLDRADCGKYQLGVHGAPVALRNQITDVKDQLGKLTAHVADVDRQQAKLDADSNELCSKKNYKRVAGGWDVTQQCETARRQAAAFSSGNDVDSERAKATALRNRIDTLTGQMKRSTETYRAKVMERARAERAHKAGELRDTGLLDRAEALWAVMTSAFYPCYFAIVLHLLLLVFDSLPVLVKFMAGVSAYDQALHDHLAGDRRERDADRRADEERARERRRAELALLRARTTDEREAAEHELVQSRVRREKERRALIEELTRALLSEEPNRNIGFPEQNGQVRIKPR